MDFKSSSDLQIFLLLLLASIAFRFIWARDLHDIKKSQLLFPQHLLGSSKGHNIEGIHTIKMHLQRYGYLSKNYNIIDTNGAYNNAFDDHLESAIKKYQMFFKLPKSGVLDMETLHQMSQARCSVPDIFENNENETSVTTSNLHIGSKYTFFPGRVKWPDSLNYRLTYALINNFPEEFKESVRTAFEIWYGRSRFNFTEVSENEGGNIRISFERGVHGDYHPFTKNSKTLAHTFAPIDGRFHFNADKPFSVDVTYNAYHLRTVALHELGHAFGLAHSPSEDAIMFPTIPTNLEKDLDMDDIEGLWELYDGFGVA